MHRSVQTKVCGLTREADVDLALSLGANYCGFIVYPKSPRGLSLERAAELASRVPQGKSVMVDVETSIEDLGRARAAGFDYFQIHCQMPIDQDMLVARSEVVGKEKLWLAPRLAPADVFPEFTLDFADTIVVDTFTKDQVGGTGRVGDWEQFQILQQNHPQTNWILAGGLTPENIKEAIEKTGATHLDINSGVESAPGIKDPKKIRQAFQIFQ